jgi:adenosylcobinamide-phosphate synthase
MSGSSLLAGFALDLVAGDPERWHPVAGFGRVATVAERAVYAPSRVRGVLVTGALVAGAAAIGSRTSLVLVTWAALGGRSLRREASAVKTLIDDRDLEAARDRLRSLCGRDPHEFGEAELARAVVESIAENTSDAVVAPLFWGAVAGPAGVAAYRAANTLDAMFGHRDDRYMKFGWAAARLDDAINLPPARVTAALTCALAPLVGGSPHRAVSITRRYGPAHPSPNAGRAEAAFAGALGLTLGGSLAYQGRVEHRPHLGEGRPPASADIDRANRLSLAVGLAATLLAAAFASARSRR